MTEGKSPSEAAKPTPEATVTPSATGIAFAVSAHGAQLELSWRNTTHAALRLATHVFAGENHYDWVKVTLVDQAGAARNLTFFDNRDESAVVVIDLAAGAVATETVDLAAWAKRPMNGGTPLATGRYEAKVVYDTTREQQMWTGRLEATTRVDVP